MLFSIVIPVYNSQDYLEDCIKSILPQIINFSAGAEMILVDDGSEDQSVKICDRYHEMHPDIVHVFHKKNEGLLLTRRFGFCKARGDYIINCDSDDMCVQTQLDDLKKIIKKTHADVIFFNSYILKDNGEKEIYYRKMFKNEESSMLNKKDVLVEYMYKSSYKAVSMCGKTFRRSCLDLDYDYSPYGRLNYGEDTMQSAEIYTLAQTFTYTNKPLYYYRMGSGMTEKYQENFYYQYKEVFNCIQDQIKRWDLDNVDWLMASKLFSIVGRAITQSRLDIQMNFKERKRYLENLRKDSFIQQYEQYYKRIFFRLQNSHKIMCSLFLSEHYRLIDILLKIKNLKI